MKFGFTLIELLLVMVIVSVLGAVSLPNFLDFRHDGKVAALRETLAAMRIGIKNQHSNMIVRCGAALGTFPPLDSLRNNDITTGGAGCTSAQLPSTTERKFVDLPGAIGTVSATNPMINPLKTMTGTVITNIITNCTCTSPCDSACTTANANSGATGFHYCYDASKGAIWALSSTTTEYSETCAL